MKSSLVFNSTTASVQKAPLEVTAECVNTETKNVFFFCCCFSNTRTAEYTRVYRSISKVYTFILDSFPPLALSSLSC